MKPVVEVPVKPMTTPKPITPPTNPKIINPRKD